MDSNALETGTTATSLGDTSGSTTTSGGSGNNFITPDDTPSSLECDVWTGMPCMRGEKCMPWDNTGSGSWNATRCSPVAPDPAGLGEPCTVEGSGVSGIDDCDAFSMCWGVNPETNQGTCVPFCKGSESKPICDDPCSGCTLTSSGVLILCLPICDPLAQQGCPEGQGCYGVSNGFSCVPNAAEPDAGWPGDPCEFVNTCQPGSFCAAADLVPGCRGSFGCCVPFCDLTGAEPCAATRAGVECVPWYEPGQAPPGKGCVEPEKVGVCVLPQ
jgi:hypothetical protein